MPNMYLISEKCYILNFIQNLKKINIVGSEVVLLKLANWKRKKRITPRS